MKKPHEQEWVVRHTNQGFIVDDAATEAVALVYYPSGEYARTIGESEAVGEARARLIAAAPAMARALMVLLHTHAPKGEEECSGCAPARAALRKAGVI